MKKFLLITFFFTTTSLFAFDYVLEKKRTAEGIGKFTLFDFSGRPGIVTLRSPSISYAIKMICNKSLILGQNISIVAFDLNGNIFEESTSSFDSSDLQFQLVRKELLSHYPKYRSKQCTLLDPSGKILGCAFFIGPLNIGIIDPSHELQTMVGADM